MKKSLIYLSFAAVLFTAGCKKTDTKVPSTQIALITQSSNDGKTSNIFEEFKYDAANNRLIEIKSYGSSGPIQTKKYYYSGSQVQYRYFLDGTESSFQAVDYTLNNEGLVREQFSPDNGFKLLYEYDDKNFITKINIINKGVAGGYYTHNYGSNNVLDSIAVYDEAGILAYVTVHTYAENKTNTIGNENKGLKIFGKDQRSLLARETRFIYNHSLGAGKRVKSFENEYVYTYDGKGRVKSSRITRTDFAYPSGNSGFYVAGSYQYTYK